MRSRRNCPLTGNGERILITEKSAGRSPADETGGTEVEYLLFILLIVFIVLFVLGRQVIPLYDDIVSKLIDALHVGR